MADKSADRALGALLGVHAGDALGATVEFMSWAEIHNQFPDGHRDIVGGGAFGWKAGAATDDTDLTRAVALGYVRYLDGGGDLLRTIADLMVDWWTGNWPGRTKGSPPDDIGAATAQGLRSYRLHGDPTCSGAGPGSAGNGSLMRCIPTAILRADPAVRRSESAWISSITHADERCTAACIVYNDAVSCLLDGGTPDDAARVAVESASTTGVASVGEAVQRGLSMSLARAAAVGETRLPDEGRGFVLDSLSIAFAALIDERPFEDVIVDVAQLGGDTDTNAAIAGGLRGAVDGLSAIPQRWINRLQFRDEFTAAATELWAHRPG